VSTPDSALLAWLGFEEPPKPAPRPEPPKPVVHCFREHSPLFKRFRDYYRSGDGKEPRSWGDLEPAFAGFPVELDGEAGELAVILSEVKTQRVVWTLKNRVRRSVGS